MTPVQPIFNLDNMLKGIPDLVGSLDLNGNIQHVNNACRNLLGYEPSEMTGRQFFDFVHPKDRHLTGKYLKQGIKSGTITDLVNRCVCKEGRVFFIRWSATWSPEDELLYFIGRDVSEIKAHEQRHNNLLESMTDAFFTLDRNWNYTYTNKELDRITKTEEQALVGKNIWDSCPEVVNNVFHQKYSHAMKTGESVRFEAFSHELQLWLEVRVFPSEEGLAVFFTDITQDKALRDEHEQLLLVANKTDNGVIIVGRYGNIEWINNGFTKQTGYSLEEAVGKLPTDLLLRSEEEVKAFEPMVAKMIAGETVAFEVINYRKDGEKIWVSAHTTPIFDENGKVSRTVTIQTDITALKKSQQELQKLSLVASKAANGVMIVNRDDKIEWVNDGFTRLTGYTLDDAIGSTPSDLLLSTDSEVKALNHVVKKVYEGEPVSFEILNYKKNGEEVWFSVQMSPVYNEQGEVDKIISIRTDITEKIRYRRELQKLSLVASKTNNSVIIADKDWRIEWVNEGFTRLTEYDMDEAVGKDSSELLYNHRTDRTAYEALEEKLLRGEPISFEELNIRKSGEEVWVNVDISAVFDDNGELSRFIEVQTDITALKEKELELAQLSQDLFKQNSDLQQFTYIVSHNLRAPVANALGLTNLLTNMDKGSEMFDKSLSHLQQSVVRLDTVVRDMNTILSIRDSKLTLEQEQVDVGLVVKQALSSFQEQLQECGGVVINEIEEGLSIKANRAYLYSIFYNLLSNAIKYRSEERPLEVRIKCVSNFGNGVRISFSDNGSGFDMEKVKDNVFKLYKRFHIDRKGRGIGLYLVKAHLEAMGGHVEVISQVGVGTRFLIYLS